MQKICPLFYHIYQFYSINNAIFDFVYYQQMKFVKFSFLHLSVSHSVQRGDLVSQHALQASRSTPKGRFRGLVGSLFQAHTQRRSWGVWPGGSSGLQPGGFPVWHSRREGGVSSSVHAGICTPPGRPPWADTPGQTLLGRHPYPVYAGRYGQQAGGMHPTGMHICLCLYSDIHTKFWPMFL